MKRLLHGIAGRMPSGMLKRIGSWQFSNPVASWIVKTGSRLVRHQDVIIRYGQGAGLKFNACHANPGYAFGTTEPLVQNVFACCLQPGDVLYDIGANVGFFTVIGAHLVGPGGKVFSFEPLPENVAAAQHNVKLNGFNTVTIVNAAVSDHSGHANLLLAAEPTWAKLESTGAEPSTTGKIEVDLICLDELVEKQAIEPPAMIKMDVEGAETEVLRGMTKIAAQHAPLILCENHGRNAEVAAILDEFGYWQHVLEEPEKSLSEARWDVHVIAGPPARQDLRDKIAELTRQTPTAGT